jgi:hypothetical protein
MAWSSTADTVCATTLPGSTARSKLTSWIDEGMRGELFFVLLFTIIYLQYQQTTNREEKKTSFKKILYSLSLKQFITHLSSRIVK